MRGGYCRLQVASRAQVKQLRLQQQCQLCVERRKRQAQSSWARLIVTLLMKKWYHMAPGGANKGQC